LQDKHVDAFTDKVGGYLNSVVGLLLRHNKAEIRTLGARLLAQFEKVQVSLHELIAVYTLWDNELLCIASCSSQKLSLHDCIQYSHIKHHTNKIFVHRWTQIMLISWSTLSLWYVPTVKCTPWGYTNQPQNMSGSSTLSACKPSASILRWLIVFHSHLTI